MRPRRKLDSDLELQRSSQGDNKHKEIEHTGSEFGQSEFHSICFRVLFLQQVAIQPHPLEKLKLRSSRFEKFEEDFISVVLRTVH